MKTVVFCLFASLCLASCNKERCWECTIKLKNEAPSTEIICNADKQDINKMEDSWKRHQAYESYNCKKQ